MPQSIGRVRVGLFEIDFKASQISRRGRRITVQEQPFRLLTMLLERPGELVSRDEIQARLWPADTYVSFDDGLNTAVRKLRVVFNDSADNPRFIQTEPRKGYRFIAPITEIMEEAGVLITPEELHSASDHSGPSRVGVNTAQLLESDCEELVTASGAGVGPHFPRTGSTLAGQSSPASSIAVLSARPTLRKRLLRTAGLALLVAAAAVAFLFRPALPAARVIGSTQLTNDGRAKATMVTDGSRVYFSYSGYVDSVHQVSTAGGETVSFPTQITVPIIIDISPDRSKLLVASCAALYEKECSLWITPIVGGSPHRVGDINAFNRADRAGRGRSPDAAWSPDGKEIVYVHGDSLFRANIDGTGSRRIIGVSPDEILYWPRWSPDGSRLRFSLETQNGETSLQEVTAEGKNLTRLLPGWNTPSSECCGSWTPDGNYFLFQSGKGGTPNVWAMREKDSLFRKAGREPVQLTTGPASTYSPLPNTDGKKLFVITTQVRGELVRFDSAGRQPTPYLGGISALGVNFSVDGKKVTYVAYPDGTLWRINADGSRRLQLTFPPLYVVQPRWSPDGTRIAFMGQERSKLWSVYVISADGGNPEQPVPGDHRGVDPSWSSDGKALLYGRDPGNEPLGAGTLDLEIVDLHTHAQSKVPGSQEMWSPRWSPDGHRIVALPRGGEGLMLFDISTQKWSELAKIGVGYPEWSRKGDYVYFLGIPSVDQPRGIFRVRIRDGKLERVASLRDFRQAPGWGDWIGLDDNDIPMLVRDAGTQDIWALAWAAP